MIREGGSKQNGQLKLKDEYRIAMIDQIDLVGGTGAERFL